ncbi:lipase 1 [Culex quinquefasciatus]|uniref:lipase 1 n=1 Tax=Culex quinquefasciatus TaxID=7176 RepID=UPI0018E35A65|nr:lipase 1 [Culex quinquefasciatus]
MRATAWWLICQLAAATIAGDREQFKYGVDDKDAELLVPEVISKYGYKVEDHTVITEDGYVLKMFRILPKRENIVGKKPVLLVHGLWNSSANFVLNGSSSFAFLLALAGYDVWLANLRGTRYSKEHTKLPGNSKEYWNFSCHEIGYYDLPAMIDHVVKVSDSEKVFYVGYSQGTTVYFIMTSTRPEYNSKIALMIAITPANLWKRLRNPLLRIVQSLFQPGTNTILMITDVLNVFQFLPYNGNFLRIGRFLCHPDVKNNLCLQLIGLVAGQHVEGSNPRTALTYLGHYPQGTSVKQVLHIAQLIGNGGKFRQFDYGHDGNLEKYGSWEPPAYNLTASTAAVVIYYGLNDLLVHPRDVQELSRMLPHVIATIPIADRKFNHVDFLLAKNVREVLYEKIVQTLEEFSAK